MNEDTPPGGGSSSSSDNARRRAEKKQASRQKILEVPVELLLALVRRRLQAPDQDPCRLAQTTGQL